MKARSEMFTYLSQYCKYSISSNRFNFQVWLESCGMSLGIIKLFFPLRRKVEGNGGKGHGRIILMVLFIFNNNNRYRYFTNQINVDGYAELFAVKEHNYNRSTYVVFLSLKTYSKYYSSIVSSTSCLLVLFSFKYIVSFMFEVHI